MVKLRLRLEKESVRRLVKATGERNLDAAIAEICMLAEEKQSGSGTVSRPPATAAQSGRTGTKNDRKQ